MQGQAVSAVILAAGLSTRLGGEPKALHSLAGQSFLRRVAAAFSQGGVKNIIVLTGHRAEECAAAAAALGLKSAHNPRCALGMFSSIQSGLAAALQEFPHSRAFMLCPVDAALLMPRSVRAMLEAWQAQSRGAEPDRIIVAAMNGRFGHPVLIPAGHLPAILARDASGRPEPDDGPNAPPGLRGYYHRLAGPAGGLKAEGGLNFLQPGGQNSGGQVIVHIPLPDAGVLSDLDSQKDSAAAEVFLALTEKRSLPSLAEAWQILALSGLSDKKIRHSILVAKGSLRLGLALAKLGLLPERSLLLLTGAGLLHDVTRQDYEHASSAARLLRGLGWPKTAFVVGCHSRLPSPYFARLGLESPDEKFLTEDIPPEAALDETLDKELFYSALSVYMADKYARRDKLSSIAERFKDIRDWFQDEPGALEGIEEREQTVLALEDYLKKLLGCQLLPLLGTATGHPLEAELDELASGEGQRA